MLDLHVYLQQADTRSTMVGAFRRCVSQRLFKLGHRLVRLQQSPLLLLQSMHHRDCVAATATRLRRHSSCQASGESNKRLQLVIKLLQHLKESTEVVPSAERVAPPGHDRDATPLQRDASVRSSSRALNNAADDQFYSNFTHDLSERLYELPTLQSTSTLPAFSNSHVFDHTGTQTEAASISHKRRFPSASSSRSRNSSTRSKFDHCLQEMLLSHSSEAPAGGSASSRASARMSAGRKPLKSSTSSSLSSCEQSADLISQVCAFILSIQ